MKKIVVTDEKIFRVYKALEIENCQFHPKTSHLNELILI